MSLAGKRSGLDGERSSLFYEAVRIIKEMRYATNGKYPRYIVWENVPGAFSSNGGEDFHRVLEEICKIKNERLHVPGSGHWTNAGEIVDDDFSLAWRVLDAQYWGVPQRRKRIYLVADFAGGSAGQILFESEGVSRYSAQGFRAWQRAAGRLAAGAGESGVLCLNDQGGAQIGVSEDVAPTLRAEDHGHPPCVLKSAGFCPEPAATLRGIGYVEEKSPTLRSAVPAVLSLYDNHGQSSRYNGPLDTAPTVTATYGMGGNNQSFVVKSTSETCPSCDGNGIATAESYCIQGSMIGRGDKNGSCGNGVNKDVSFTLNTVDCHAVQNGYVVRRLIPAECARLQGFPDWWCADLGTEQSTDEELAFWTDVWETHRKVVSHSSKPKTEKQIRKWLKNPYTDAAEYRMWGNGVALPCVAFVLSGIAYYSQLPAN